MGFRQEKLQHDEGFRGIGVHFQWLGRFHSAMNLSLLLQLCNMGSPCPSEH